MKKFITKYASQVSALDYCFNQEEINEQLLAEELGLL